MLESDSPSEPLSLDSLFSLTGASVGEHAVTRNGLDDTLSEAPDAQEDMLMHLFAHEIASESRDAAAPAEFDTQENTGNTWLEELLAVNEVPPAQASATPSSDSFSLAAALGVVESEEAEPSPATQNKESATPDLMALFGVESPADEPPVESPVRPAVEPESVSTEVLFSGEEEVKAVPKATERSIRSKFADVPAPPPERIASPEVAPEPPAPFQARSAAHTQRSEHKEALSPAAHALFRAIQMKPCLQLPEKGGAPKVSVVPEASVVPEVPQTPSLPVKEAPEPAPEPDSAPAPLPKITTPLPKVAPVVSERQEVAPPPCSPSESETAAQKQPKEEPSRNPRRSLVVIGASLCVVAVLAAAGAFALAVGGEQLDSLPSASPAGVVAGESSSTEYHYKVRSAEGALCPVSEKASFDGSGVLVESEMTVQLPDENQAHLFLEEASAAFGSSLKQSEVRESSVWLVVSAEGEAVDQRTYVELLRRSVIDFDTE